MEITEKKLREAFILTPQDIEDTEETLEKQLTHKASIELVANITEACTAIRESLTKLNPVDMIGWYVRCAFKLGYMAATSDFKEVLEVTVEALLEGES